MSKKIDTAVRERDILRAKVEPIGWTLRGWNSLCDYSAWDKHGELVTIGPAVDGLICDNATLRARMAEVEEKRDEAVERLREELKRGIRLEAKLSEAAAGFPGLRDAIVEEVEAEFKARVEKLERERWAWKASTRNLRELVANLDKSAQAVLDAALAECGEGE